MEIKMTTNVKPEELNYDHYSTEKYDRDIVNSIPFHKEIHMKIAEFVRNNYRADGKYSVIDLGVGTGITSKLIRDILPNADLDVVDFSEQMMEGARKKLGNKNVNYIAGDFSTLEFPKKYDIVIAVIGVHHQNHKGKQQLFRKIYSMLKPNGVFIFGDLVTYKDNRKAALNNALHYTHLVEHATDEKTLEEWAHHHMFLNDLAPVEDQIKWLQEDGFKVEQSFLKFNTSLLFCKK